MSDELKTLNETNPQDYQKVYEVIHELLNDRELAKSNNLPEMIRRAYYAGYADSKNTRPIEDELRKNYALLEQQFQITLEAHNDLEEELEQNGKRIAALEQKLAEKEKWQREAVPYLCGLSDYHRGIHQDIERLIEQAERR